MKRNKKIDQNIIKNYIVIDIVILVTLKYCYSSYFDSFLFLSFVFSF